MFFRGVVGGEPFSILRLSLVGLDASEVVPGAAR